MLPREALYHIFADDKTILITGSKGDGKTNLGSVIQETLIELLGFYVWTNMHFFLSKNVEKAKKKGKLADMPGHVYVDKPEKVHIVKSLSELLLGIVDSVPTSKVFLLDEAGIHADSSHSSGKSTRTIKQLNRIIRHFECCFIILTQTKGSVPPDLREKDVDYHFRMRKTREGYIVEIGKKRVETDEFTGEDKITFPTVKRIRVPLTKYPVDGKFPTGFSIDIDLKEALDRLSEVGDSIEMMDKGRGKKIILEIIAEAKKGKKVKVTKKSMIMSEFYNNTKLSLHGLAKKYKTSYENVCNIHAKFLREIE